MTPAFQHDSLEARTTRPIATRSDYSPHEISSHENSPQDILYCPLESSSNGQLAPWTARPMDSSPPWARPMDSSPHEQLAHGQLAHGQLAPWTAHLIDNSPHDWLLAQFFLYIDEVHHI